MLSRRSVVLCLLISIMGTVFVFAQEDAPDGFPGVYTTTSGTPLIIAPEFDVQSFTEPEHGTVAIYASGGVVYTPDADFMGADSFTLSTSDILGATVNVLVVEADAKDKSQSAVASVSIGRIVTPVIVETPAPQTQQPQQANTQQDQTSPVNNAETAPACTAEELANPLAYLSGWLDASTNYTTGYVTNTSNCYFPIGMASYRKFDDIIANQQLFGSVVASALPNSTTPLSVSVPDCARQIDLFYGDVIFDLSTARYNERLFEAQHPGGSNFCTPDNGTGEPAISVVFGPDQTIAPGERAPLTLTVTNTGGVRLVNLRSAAPETDACSREPFDLEPGQSASFTCLSNPFTETTTIGVEVSGLVDYGDANYGGIGGTDNVTLTVVAPVASISVDYAADQTITAGETVQLTLTVTNTGDLRLVTLRSAAPETDACSREPFDLEPGQTVVFNCTTIPFNTTTTINAEVFGWVDTPDGSLQGIGGSDTVTITVQ
ncbi:MAG: Ig-like domain-containing protein [Aggregatilineales bacterium]